MGSDIFYYGCGLNISKQIPVGCKNELPFLCCLLELPTIKCLPNRNGQPVQISFSHIFWKNGNDWELSGSKWSDSEDIFSSIKSSPLVRSSEKRIVFLKENGDVMVCTSSTLKKLHLQYTVDLETKEARCGAVTDFAVEDNCLLLIDDNGKLFSSGIEIALPGIKVKEVSVGKEHCLALTEGGDVLSWGSGMRGQLGNGEINKVEYPEKVVSLQGIEIATVCCGGWHSAVLSVTGDVYIWGWNDVGQLGFHSQSLRREGVKWDTIDEEHTCRCNEDDTQGTDEHKAPTETETSSDVSKEKGSEEEKIKKGSLINANRFTGIINVQTSPKLLDFWTLEIPVKKIACGDRHTVFLLENGTAWTTGWNLYGQLGIGSNESMDEPQLIPARSVRDIFAGGWNSVLALSHPSGTR